MFRQSETITNYLHIQPLRTFWHRDRFPQVFNNVSLSHWNQLWGSTAIAPFTFTLQLTLDKLIPRNTVQFNGFIFSLMESLIDSIRKWQNNFNQAHFGTCARCNTSIYFETIGFSCTNLSVSGFSVSALVWVSQDLSGIGVSQKSVSVLAVHVNF